MGAQLGYFSKSLEACRKDSSLDRQLLFSWKRNPERLSAPFSLQDCDSAAPAQIQVIEGSPCWFLEVHPGVSWAEASRLSLALRKLIFPEVSCLREKGTGVRRLWKR